MSKLKYKLVRQEQTVLFQILEQDTRFHANHLQNFVFRDKNGFGVLSRGGIALDHDAVYLRGMLEEDPKQVAKRWFASSAAADEYIEKVHRALREWSDECEVFSPFKSARTFSAGDKLKYNLIVVSDPVSRRFNVHFRVIEQDERFRRTGPRQEVFFKATNDFIIESHTHPSNADGPKHIFLQGSERELDNKSTFLSFGDVASANGYVEKVHAALAEWAEKAKQFDPMSGAQEYTL